MDHKQRGWTLFIHEPKTAQKTDDSRSVPFFTLSPVTWMTKTRFRRPRTCFVQDAGGSWACYQPRTMHNFYNMKGPDQCYNTVSTVDLRVFLRWRQGIQLVDSRDASTVAREQVAGRVRCTCRSRVCDFIARFRSPHSTTSLSPSGLHNVALSLHFGVYDTRSTP